MRGKKAKELRKKVRKDWENLQLDKKAPFKMVWGRIKRAYSRGLIKEGGK
jgi:hypothetical protein